MILSRSAAVRLACAAIAAVIALQVFNSFACYHHGAGELLHVFGVFIALPLLPALVSLFSANPLRAVGACALFAPWLVLAYYTDCVAPYQGGGASMVYVAVLLYGTPSALVGALLTGPVLRRVGVSVAARAK